MNETIEIFARDTLKFSLQKLPEGWQNKFKLMYGCQHSAEVALSIPIEAVVDGIPSDKLDWALSQVENSLRKIHKDNS